MHTVVFSRFEPPHDKTNKMFCAPSKDSDQIGQIRVFAACMKKAWFLSYPLSTQRRLWSNWTNAQADLSLRWVHSHFVCFVIRRLFCRNFKTDSMKSQKCMLRKWLSEREQFLNDTFQIRLLQEETTLIRVYRKFPKYSDTQTICCNHSKIWTMWFYHRVMSPNDTDGMANSVDPDQTAPLEA